MERFLYDIIYMHVELKQVSIQLWNSPSKHKNCYPELPVRMPGGRGSIAFFGTYRPPVPLDIYSSPIKVDNSKEEEEIMTDGNSYNFNGQVIPADALEAILRHPKLDSLVTEEEADVRAGMAFVSERTNSLETLHLALRIDDDEKHKHEVFSFADLYDGMFDGARMEDSACFAGDYLIYVSTKEPVAERRQPWTAVYRTDLNTKETLRLTPPGSFSAPHSGYVDLVRFPPVLLKVQNSSNDFNHQFKFLVELFLNKTKLRVCFFSELKLIYHYHLL